MFLGIADHEGALCGWQGIWLARLDYKGAPVESFGTGGFFVGESDGGRSALSATWVNNQFATTGWVMQDGRKVPQVSLFNP